MRPSPSPSPSPRLHLSGRLVDLRALLATYGDIPLRVLARDLAGPDAPDYPPARPPARVPARYS
jgi:hypothetical protein